MKRFYRALPQVSIPLMLLSLILGVFFFTGFFGGLAAGFSNVVQANETRPRVESNIYQMVTGDDSEEDRRGWDNLYNTPAYVFGKDPSAFLKENVHRLSVGKALDIGMGEGRNAVFLAKKGFNVVGVDISEVALRKAKRLARENRVSITIVNSDLRSFPFKPETYDVVMNIDLLLRRYIPEIKKTLKSGGYVVYEAQTVEQLKNTKDKQLRRDTLLEKGELKELFKDFEIVVYRESNDGKDARASLIARKP